MNNEPSIPNERPALQADPPLPSLWRPLWKPVVYCLIFMASVKAWFAAAMALRPDLATAPSSGIICAMFLTQPPLWFAAWIAWQSWIRARFAAEPLAAPCRFGKLLAAVYGVVFCSDFYITESIRLMVHFQLNPPGAQQFDPILSTLAAIPSMLINSARSALCYVLGAGLYATIFPRAVRHWTAFLALGCVFGSIDYTWSIWGRSLFLMPWRPSPVPRLGGAIFDVAPLAVPALVAVCVWLYLRRKAALKAEIEPL